ncbi:hypothetical protein Nepgr_010067 [Nepenthes gracilis]|uniref:Fatty acyl-CoA reductase n=1 Tax=Nepenthes gracilis TaxID=150966 RepID=A0AAD3SBW8_NEPGR|nr:hypothetical protein Nepgr_010067 [Nepenthes gracilis]
MGALFQNSFTITPKGIVLEFPNYNHQPCSLSKKKCLIYCQSSGNVTKANKLSSVLSERSVLINSDHGAAGIDASSSLGLAPNGKSPAELPMKDLPSYGGSVVQVQEGIGIVKFLRGKAFFITGATGFLAKVLIEKLLRTVPDVGKIYVLIKAKNKEAAYNRFINEIINAEIFKFLQQIHGKSYDAFMLSKLVPVVGNICESNLGLDEDLANKIAEEVDIIVNSAANTTFHERYDVAININTRGPGRVMGFAKRCKRIKVVLQVSTAYVNGQRQGRIMEKPFRMGDSIERENLESKYPASLLPVLDVEEEISLAFSTAEALEDHKVAQKMKELGLERARKYGWQDTYVFTKAIGEMLLGNLKGDVPVVILRPSIIESTCNDPFPGWIEGNRMMDPILKYYGKGQLSGFLVDPNAIIDVVPADMVVNAILAAIAKHGIDGKPELSVYQVASSVINPLVYRDLADLICEHFTRLPCLDSNGRPIRVEKFKFFSTMEDFSSHIWMETIRQIGSSTAAATAAAAPILNRNLSRKLEKICKKYVEQAMHLASVYQPYSFYGGRFDSSRTQSLAEIMSEEEKRTFHFDVGSIDWKDYISNIHIPGLRRHVMKGRGLNV